MKKFFERIIYKIIAKYMVARFNSKSYQKKMNHYLDNFDEWLYSED